MSRKFLVLSALTLGLIVPASAKTYTREEAVQTAIENSPEIKSAEEDLIRASSQVDAGYGNAYPSVDISATVTRIFGLDDVKDGTPITDAAKDSSMEANKFDKNVLAPALDGITKGMKSQAYRWQSSVGLTVTQVLYAAGKVGTAIDIAKAYKLKQELALEYAKISIRYAIEKSFDNCVIIDSSIAILEATIKLTEENLASLKQSYESGLSTELDLLRLQLSLDAYKSDLQTAKNNYIVAKNALLLTMGLEWDPDIQLNGELRSPDSNLPYPDTVMANVLQRRKDIAMLNAAMTILEKNIDIEKGGYKPTVALVGGLKYTNNQNKITEWDAPKWDKLNKYVALNVSMNLFNGMQTKEAVVQAKSNLRSTQIQKETLEKSIRLEIETDAKALTTAEEQLVILKNNIDLAQRIYDMTEAAYKNGSETQLNLIAAGLSLHQAKLNYIKGVQNWNTAYDAMLTVTGEY